MIHCFIRYLRHCIKCKACLASGGGKITDVDWQENERMAYIYGTILV